MKHILPIASTYVSSWGVYESVRELIQNAADEAQERPENKMVVEHVDGWLHISNKGADLGIQALLIGGSDKAGKRGLRGKHGEGLDLALLCAARAEVEIKVSTKTEVWTPCIEYVKEYGSRCLVVNTRKHIKPRDGVKVSLHLDKNTWESMRSKFLFLEPPREQMESDSGSLIFDPERKGQIFVKGIYVMTSHKIGFGFDLKDVALDRDRRVIAGFDLQWACGQIVRDALGRDPARYVAPVMELLEKGSEETEYLGSHLDITPGGRQELAKAFREKHGQDAVPVGSLAESQQLDRLGARGIVVNNAMVRALGAEMADYSKTAARLRMTPKVLYGWHELTESEQAVVTACLDRMAPVAGEHMAEKCQLKVCDFNDESIHGTCELATGEIHVARARLTSLYDMLEVAVHELAHAITQASDGDELHIRAIETVWRKLYEAADECRLTNE